LFLCADLRAAPPRPRPVPAGRCALRHDPPALLKTGPQVRVSDRRIKVAMASPVLPNLPSLTPKQPPRPDDAAGPEPSPPTAQDTSSAKTNAARRGIGCTRPRLSMPPHLGENPKPKPT